MSTTTLPPSSIPLFTTVATFREWRHRAFLAQKSVGFVPTMGALHNGHISLVQRSLQENDLTVLSIFVNPAQFAPHEDLTTYPRTLPQDLELLAAQKVSVPTGDGSTTIERTPSAVFLPTVQEMYPSGIDQNVATQKGTFVEVKGYGHQMEGTSRPTFFRGVATVVTKLLNAIQPTHAYFGQKDIQQALLLRRLSRDLLFSHPAPQNMHIVPTARDPTTHLALSSRNAYLSPSGLLVAPTLQAALRAAEQAWNSGYTKEECIQRALGAVKNAKTQWIENKGLDVEMRLDYIEMNDAESFEVLKDDITMERHGTQQGEVILSGALWVDKTRLIDNIILGNVDKIIR